MIYDEAFIELKTYNIMYLADSKFSIDKSRVYMSEYDYNFSDTHDNYGFLEAYTPVYHFKEKVYESFLFTGEYSSMFDHKEGLWR